MADTGADRDVIGEHTIKSTLLIFVVKMRYYRVRNMSLMFKQVWKLRECLTGRLGKL